MRQVVDLLARRGNEPNTVNGKVAPPRRRPNHETRTREYLTPPEVDSLLAAASASQRHGCGLCAAFRAATNASIAYGIATPSARVKLVQISLR